MSRLIQLSACLLLAAGVAAQTPKTPTPAQALAGMQGVWLIQTFNGQPAGGQALPSDPAALGALGWPR